MKVLICWSHISGYMAACCAALTELGLDLQIVAFKADVSGSAAAFKDDVVAGLNIRLLSPVEQADHNLVHSIATESKADIIVIPGWFQTAYRALVTAPELSGVKFVMTMDTPRRDTLRQRLGRFKIGGMLKRLDRVMVPGERAWQLARLLGIPESKIRRGLYGIDFDQLEPLLKRRESLPNGWPRKFLYVGRYAEEKAIDVLVKAYSEYRRMSENPWPLTCCGSGPLDKLLAGVPGIVDRGFVQPKDVHQVLAEHGVFVLASRYDPWPLVLVEAAAAGLPAVYSEACGSAVEVYRDYFSGRSFATDDPMALARSLKWFERHDWSLAAMGKSAQPLAAAYSAKTWALRWTEMFDELLAGI